MYIIFALTLMVKEIFYAQYAAIIPHAPGIYKYYNGDKKLLYVGKAKNLKKRVFSYFAKKHDHFRLNKLVASIELIEWTVTDNEHDAFLLENSLIKHFKPPFNIRLKDDKAYPFVVIKKEHFPRVFLTRQHIKDGSEYIGPFTDVSAVRDILNIVKQTIQLRTCSLNLDPKNIAKGKYNVCLEYHLGNCKGPCVGNQPEEAYLANINNVRNLLRGHLAPIIQDLKATMQSFANDLAFEKAQQIKVRLDALQRFQSKSTVVNTHLGNMDVASITMEDQVAFVNYMVVVDGLVLHSKNVYVEMKLEENATEILSYTIAHLRSTFKSKSTEIIVPFNIDVEDETIEVHIPKAGTRKKLLEMSFTNLGHYREQYFKKKALHIVEKTSDDYLAILAELQTQLRLPVLPDHIECFDNSNFQGSYPVAAMVCFKDGQPSKKDYRHFHIKTVEGINDFASMEEIVYRRYKRLVDEQSPLPKLVIIDGGKGQLGAAMNSVIQLGIENKMTVIGLAKREESIFFPGKSDPIQLPFNSPALLLIRRIRDEVHRFGITFHRATRSKGTIKNELESIAGIGAKTAQTLLQSFRSVKNIKTASLEALMAVVDAKKAKIVFDFFQKESD